MLGVLRLVVPLPLVLDPEGFAICCVRVTRDAVDIVRVSLHGRESIGVLLVPPLLLGSVGHRDELCVIKHLGLEHHTPLHVTKRGARQVFPRVPQLPHRPPDLPFILQHPVKAETAQPFARWTPDTRKRLLPPCLERRSIAHLKQHLLPSAHPLRYLQIDTPARHCDLKPLALLPVCGHRDGECCGKHCPRPMSEVYQPAPQC
mmetsp:Transcript_26804/g.62074  ORF Transcript_26804/g.62074 Transcript_26804/m.62074 type:complete len:203 (+) Transcript_26804:398-1006(+)